MGILDIFKTNPYLRKDLIRNEASSDDMVWEWRPSANQKADGIHFGPRSPLIVDSDEAAVFEYPDGCFEVIQGTRPYLGRLGKMRLSAKLFYVRTWTLTVHIEKKSILFPPLKFHFYNQPFKAIFNCSFHFVLLPKDPVDVYRLVRVFKGVENPSKLIQKTVDDLFAESLHILETDVVYEESFPGIDAALNQYVQSRLKDPQSPELLQAIGSIAEIRCESESALESYYHEAKLQREMEKEQAERNEQMKREYEERKIEEKRMEEECRKQIEKLKEEMRIDAEKKREEASKIFEEKATNNQN